MKVNNTKGDGELFLFDNETMIRAANDQQLVMIEAMDHTPLKVPDVGGQKGFTIKKPFVTGYLQGEFSYNLSSEWSALLDGIVGGGALGKISQFTGNPLYQSGLFKRKFYKGGSYITFNLDFRIVCEEEYGLKDNDEGRIKNPKVAAHWLAGLCLPTEDPSALEAIKSGWNAVSTLAVDAYNTVSKVADIPLTQLPAKTKTAASAKVEQVVKKLDKPYGRTCRIKIGSMFDSYDMIVDSVNIKYSREMVYSDVAENKSHFDNLNTARRAQQKNSGASGVANLRAYIPLYIDVTVGCSTRTIPTVSKDGSANTGLLSPQPSVSIVSEVDDIAAGLGLGK